MKHVLSLFIALCTATTLSAQRVSKNYHNTTMPEVLRDLNQSSDDYTINFMYNELEDYRVTTQIHRKTIPEALLQVIGFYPVRVVTRGKNQIFVESIHNTNRHLTGTIIDEEGLPLAYANIAVLNPTDSTLLSGGVSNESGYFAIPIAPLPEGRGGSLRQREEPVLARISYVGYKTMYRLCYKSGQGTIRMQPDNLELNGVVVQGERPKVQMQGNSLVMNVEGTVMARLGTAEDVLSRVPTISKKGDDYEILGKGAPLIYVNNRKLTDLGELRNIQSDNIRSVEVVQNPGARYDASVQAVIVIRTRRAQGEGLGVELTSWSRKGHGYANNERVNLTYRTGKLELFANLFGAYNKRWEKGEFEQTVFADTLWTINNRQKFSVRNPYLDGRAGFNYQIDDNNSLGGFYEHIYDYVKTSGADDDELLANGVMYDHLTNNSVKRAEGLPRHQVNLYYVGKIGKADIDFNADYTFRRQRNRTEQQELSREHDDRDVNTDNLTRGKMAAEKLIVSHPLWKGQVTVGEEYTYTQWDNEFENAEGYIANSNNEQHESNIAPFVELRQQVGRFQLQAGLRYEHVVSDYYVSGIRRDDQSRTYDDLFPSFSASTGIPLSKDNPANNLQLSFSYTKRTNRPAYWQLSSDVVYENRLNLQTGNPYLKPNKFHTFNLTAMWRGFYMMTNFSRCIDPILYTAESMPGDSKVNFVTYKNYDHADWLTITLGAQKNVKLGSGATWTPQYNVMLMKPWFKSTFLDADKTFNRPMLALQLGNIVTLPHDWLVQADFSMHTHGYQQNVWFNCTNAMLSLNISKDLFKRKLNIKLSGNDLFNQGINRFTLYSNRMMFRKTEDNDSRCVTLSLRYRFNVTPSKYRGTGAGNAEKNRL